jgi:hypothetical protein
MHKWRVKKQPYLYNPNKPVGENVIAQATKQFAQLLGFDNWERCTNHGNRALAITVAATNANQACQKIVRGVARHKSEAVHFTYQRPNTDMRKNYHKAISGKHYSSPPPSPEDRKLLRIEEEKKDFHPELIVEHEGKEKEMIEAHENDNMAIASFNNDMHGQLTAYQNLADKPPFVTPAFHPEQKTVVNQNHLNNIQRNIFFQQPSDTSLWAPSFDVSKSSIPSTVEATRQRQIDELMMANQKLQEENQRIVAEKKKIEEDNQYLMDQVVCLEQQLVKLKEKYQESKQELRDARQAALLQKQSLELSAAATLYRKLSDLQAATIAVR